MRKISVQILLLTACTMLLGCDRDDIGIFRSASSRIMKGAVVTKVETKSVAPADGANSGEVLLSETPITLEDGTDIILSAYLSDMDDSDLLPARTKAVEVTTSSIRSQSFLMNVYDDGESVYSSVDTENKDPEYTGDAMQNLVLKYDDDEKEWKFGKDYYWPETVAGHDAKPLTFCSFAPIRLFDESRLSVKNIRIEGGKLKLDYSQPVASGDAETASGDALIEPDLLVGMDKQTIEEHGGMANVVFKHALTGVRFLCGDLHNVKVEAITLDNFYGSGTMTLDKNAESGNGVTWEVNSTDLRSFSQPFDVRDDIASGDAMDASNNKERTFMMIPQKLHDDAAILLSIGGNIHAAKVRFNALTKESVGGSTDAKKEENIALIKDWSKYAGKVITFRISLAANVNSVNVSVTDQVVGLTKQDIVIKNEGTSPIFIRASLVGNWTNEDDQILSSWSETQPFGKFYDGSGSEFGFPTTLPDRWRESTVEKGIYYYNRVVMPGDAIKQNLFDKFTVTSIPKSDTGSWEGNVKMQIANLEMYIIVQAVSAVVTDSEGKWVDQTESYTLDYAQTAWGTLPFSTIVKDK